MMIHFRIFLLLTLLGCLLTSAKGTKSPLEGEWKIETVIYEGDTLYQFNSAHYTIGAYTKLTQGWEPSKEDLEYSMKCLGATIYGFKSMRLNFSENKLTKGVLDPCWDHIRVQRIENGTFTFTNNNVTIFDADNAYRMSLRYHKTTDRLHYSDAEWDYQIIYSRKM